MSVDPSFQRPISGSINALNGALDLTNPNSAFQTLQISGTWSGSLVVEGSNDGSTYTSLQVIRENTKAVISSITSNGIYSSSTNGFQFYRIRASAWTSGTAQISSFGSDVSTNIYSRSNLINSSGTEIATQMNPLITSAPDPHLVGTQLLAVATSISLFEHFYKSGLGFTIWSTASALGGSESFNTAQKVADITVPTTSGAYFYKQTRKRFRYFPGRPLQASMTFNPNGTQTNIRKRFGYFDVNDGMFLQFDGTDISFVIRSSSSGSPSDALSIPRSSWYDPLDGTGPSGQAIDFTKTVFMLIEFLWQGAGYVKLSFLQGNKQLVAVKRDFFGSTNGLTSSYMANPILPFRIELQNTGTSVGTTIKHICTSLRVFTDDVVEGIPQAINNGTTGKSSTNTPIISLRVSASTPTRNIELTNGDAFVTGANSTAYINIYLNPTLTGASWVSVGNASEYDLSATSFTGGTLVSSKIIRGNTPVTLQDVIPYINKILGEDINGTKDIVSIVVRSFSGTVTSHCTLEWREL